MLPGALGLRPRRLCRLGALLRRGLGGAGLLGLALRRDAFSALADGRDQARLSEVERPIHSVPESARASQLLEEFNQRREHLFAVVDEYGGFAGIVTLEDVIEEIVGREIVGEFDPAVDMRERARQTRQALTDSAPE